MFGSWRIVLRWGGVGLVGDVVVVVVVVGVGHEVVDEAVEIRAFQDEGVVEGVCGIHWGKGFEE